MTVLGAFLVGIVVIILFIRLIWAPLEGPLRNAYLVLVGLAVVSVLLLASGAQFDTPGFGLNLATEVIGIGLTLVFVDRALRKQEEQKLHRYKTALYKKLKGPLFDHIELWHAIFTSIQRPGKKYAWRYQYIKVWKDIGFEDYTREDVVSLLMKFDPSRRNAETGESGYSFLEKQFRIFEESFKEALDIYAPHARPEDVEKIEACLNRDLFKKIYSRAEDARKGKFYHIFCIKRIGTAEAEVCPSIKWHLSGLLDLANILNEGTANPRARLIVKAGGSDVEGEWCG